MISKTQIAEWRKLAEGASKDWIDATRGGDPYHYINFGGGFGAKVDFECGNEVDFIIASRTAVPLLLEVVEKMENVVKAAKVFGDSHPIPIICPDCADTGQFADLLVALCELEEVYAPESEEK